MRAESTFAPAYGPGAFFSGYFLLVFRQKIGYDKEVCNALKSKTGM